MQPPTLDILDAIRPKYAEYQGMKPVDERYNAYTSPFSLNNQAWNKFHLQIAKVKFQWQEIKYSEVVERITIIDDVVPDTIGVYLFIVKANNLIYDLPKYVYYVGIAGATARGRSLKERLKDYFKKSHIQKRDAIRILIYKHYDNVYIGYSSVVMPLGMTIEKLESALIGFFGTHFLANRDDIPADLKPQSKAFNI